jgi:hypothetical protein
LKSNVSAEFSGGRICHLLKDDETMSMFSRFSAISFPTMPASPDRLTCARNYYKRASETLFELCYQIQVAGKPPNPAFLTEAVLQYREARALIEQLESTPSTGAAQGIDALASGQK